MFRTSISIVANDERIRRQIQEQGFESFRGSAGAAGYDLHACLGNGHTDYGNGFNDYTLSPGETLMVDTGLSIYIGNAGFAAFVLPRSGIASKKTLAPINTPGLIDSDYQGPLKVALHNHGKNEVSITDFERIAQLVFMPVVEVRVELVTAHKNATQRGEGGFGSTGTGAL